MLLRLTSTKENRMIVSWIEGEIEYVANARQTLSYLSLAPRVLGTYEIFVA